MILRLTQKLNTKIKAGQLVEMSLDENPFADWSCHLFTAQRTQYIILTNTASLYSCLMCGKGIIDDSRLTQRASATIREFIENDGHPDVYQHFIAPATGTVRFAKALNRSVTGSMNNNLSGKGINVTPFSGRPCGGRPALMKQHSMEQTGLELGITDPLALLDAEDGGNQHIICFPSASSLRNTDTSGGGIHQVLSKSRRSSKQVLLPLAASSTQAQIRPTTPARLPSQSSKDSEPVSPTP